MTALAPTLPASAMGADTETFAIGERAMQAPPIVCLQFGDTSGNHEVLVTKRVRDGLFHLFDKQREQIWWHNGPYDIAVILEWYPELSELVWLALQECRVLDTMYLQRMIQIARGDIGGPLALDATALAYGLPPPTKNTQAEPPWQPGVLLDVRTSFGLWYNAESIPEPWYGYADYDGEVMLPLAARMVERYCTPKPGQRYPLVRLEDLGQTVRTYVGHHLWRTYGLRVNQTAVSDLAVAAKAALRRLQDTAQLNGFLKPKYTTGKRCPASTRPEDPKKVAAWDKKDAERAGHEKALAAGKRPTMSCPVKWEQRPPTAGKKQDAWDRRAAKHKHCKGCKLQMMDADGAPLWSKNTKALKAAVVVAYEGNPPLTEPKKDKKTGRMTGGGQVATSRHVLQDSQNSELEAWSQYNEWAALMSKDMKIFARGVVHTRIGIANTLRITSGDPNVLNFRRTSFFVGKCEKCGHEEELDPRELKKGKDTMIECPECGT